MTGPVVFEKKSATTGDGTRNIYNTQQETRLHHRSSTQLRSEEQNTGSVQDATMTNNGIRSSAKATNSGIITESNAIQSASTPDVGSVVSKAKRAAQSLWLLLHAQNCRIGGNKCPHVGCTEAKKVLLHLKMCTAGTGQECPLRVNGCFQSRKLLAHYQKCRDLRAKQAGMGRRAKSQQHICLVCSLVARQARSLLEGGRPTFPKKAGATRKQVIASFTLNQNAVGGSVTVPHNMPPPPPRISAPIPIKQAPNASEAGKMVESPPSQNHLMLFSEVAAAAAPPPLVIAAEPEVLSKSLDSSRSTFLTFAANALHSLKSTPPPPTGRIRAESFDERAVKVQRLHAKMRQEDCGNDPTVELELQREEPIQELAEPRQAQRRGRSASLGVLASCCVAQKAGVCDTIAEEGTSQEYGRIFEMDEEKE